MGLMFVPQDRTADPENQGTMSLDEGRESQFRRLAAPIRKPFEQLAIGEASGHAHVEGGRKLPSDDSIPSDRH